MKNMIALTGIGYDIHRFAEVPRPLMLGGVHIPSSRGLDGHSDADVLCHAIADALLGEITPAMAAAVCQSPARRVLVPINHCENIVVGVPDQPIGQLVAAAAQKVKELAETPCK
mgnify:CR=1 FL=1